LRAQTGAEPMLLMTGGAASKVAPIIDLPFETVETLIFEGLLLIQSRRLALYSPAGPPPEASAAGVQRYSQRCSSSYNWARE
jgi:hypothetical protein